MRGGRRAPPPRSAAAPGVFWVVDTLTRSWRSAEKIKCRKKTAIKVALTVARWSDNKAKKDDDGDEETRRPDKGARGHLTGLSHSLMRLRFR